MVDDPDTSVPQHIPSEIVLDPGGKKFAQTVQVASGHRGPVLLAPGVEREGIVQEGR